MNKKTIHFSILLLFLAFFIWLFYLFSGQPGRQFTIVFLASCFYYIWGIAYHVLEGDFHFKIVVEYLLIALLALIMLRGAIYK